MLLCDKEDGCHSYDVGVMRCTFMSFVQVKQVTRQLEAATAERDELEAELNTASGSDQVRCAQLFKVTEVPIGANNNGFTGSHFRLLIRLTLEHFLYP